MDANHDKRCFTFFGFLPPYIGVSGSLVYSKRQILKRAIDWYQKLLISCLVARRPFMCSLEESIENRSEIYRKSIENRSNIYRTSIEHLQRIYRNLSNVYQIWGLLGPSWDGFGKHSGRHFGKHFGRHLGPPKRRKQPRKTPKPVRAMIGKRESAVQS